MRTRLKGTAWEPLLLPLGDAATHGAREEPVIALEVRSTKKAWNTGHVSHDAQARIDKRVARILAARDAVRRLARGPAV